MRNIRNTKSTSQMALKWERFPDESFKYKWSSRYDKKSIQDIHVQVLYLGHALSAKAVYYLYYSMFLPLMSLKFSLGAESMKGIKLHRPLLLLHRDPSA
jgi:hypothetical protein